VTSGRETDRGHLHTPRDVKLFLEQLCNRSGSNFHEALINKYAGRQSPYAVRRRVEESTPPERQQHSLFAHSARIPDRFLHKGSGCPGGFAVTDMV